MRTMKCVLAAALIAAVGVTALPALSAAKSASASISNFEKRQNKRIRAAKENINILEDMVAALEGVDGTQNSKNDAQDTSINDIKATLDTIIAAVPEVTDALTALKNGLTALQGAILDPVTGLVGLNAARTQFAAFGDGGGFIGGTTDGGGRGPDDDATYLGNGTYVIDFNNDVSNRFLTVNVLPDSGGAMYTGEAVSCRFAQSTCNAASVPVADYGDNVVVAIQGQPGGPNTGVVPSPPVGGAFAVAAISG